MHGDGVEAIIDRDISRQRVKNTLLRLDRKTRAPAVHGLRPLDRMDADIGAAVDGYHAVAMHKSPQFQQLQSQLDFFRIEGREFKNLKSDVIAAAGFADLEFEAIENHRVVIGRGENESQCATTLTHGESPIGRGRNKCPRARIRRDASSYPLAAVLYGGQT